MINFDYLCAVEYRQVIGCNSWCDTYNDDKDNDDNDDDDNDDERWWWWL